MNIDPQKIQMLTAALGGGQTQQGQGATTPANAAAQLMQRVMLMRALQKPPQQQSQPPNPNTPQTQINLPQPGGQPNPMMDV